MKTFLKSVLPDPCESFVRNAFLQGRRLRRNRGRMLLAEGVSCRLLGEAGTQTFFGYYDISPFEPEGERVLACRLSGLRVGQPMALGSFDLNREEGSDFQSFAQTDAWCWQQSCRLRWMPAAGAGQVLFNRLGRQGFESVLFDIDKGREEQKFVRPLYDVDARGRHAVTLNFQRLQRLRPGYGYRNLPDPSEGKAEPDNDGIWLVDLASGDCRLLHSLRELASLEPQDSMSGALHYINHLSWNPSGTRFLFFHIWERPGERRRIRLITSDTRGGLRLVTNEQHVSHYCWLGDTTTMLYATIKGVEGYHEVPDLAGGEASARHEPALPGRDGHPSWNPARGELLFDTLPDEVSERSLRTYCPGGDHSKFLASFYSPATPSQESRCDLHPRWRADGSVIAVDTTHNGYRQMALLSGF